MNINQLTFIAPGYDVQDLSHRNVLSAPLGKVFPILFEYVNPGEVSEIDFSWFSRTFPMVAPLMDTMEITFDGFWIPARVLSHSGGKSIPFDYEEFFNPRNISSGTSLPKMKLSFLVEKTLERYGSLEGSLYDYLGYPTFPKFFEEFWKMIASGRSQLSGTSPAYYASFYTFDETLLAWMIQNTNAADDCVSTVWQFRSMATADYESLSSSEVDEESSMSFTYFVWYKVAGTDLTDRADSLYWQALYKQAKDSGIDPFTWACNQLKTSALELFTEWKTLILPAIWESWNSSDGWYSDIFASTYRPDYFIEIIEEDVDVTPFIVYSKVTNDWYISPLLNDGDEIFKNMWTRIITNTNPSTADWNRMFNLANRLYEFDRFVSATPGSDQPNVLLPANPSVKDIRSANRLQLMLERVMKTGKRYVDQILTTFGIKPSDARVDRSEVLFRRQSFLDIQTVTQTNQSSLNAAFAQPLGSFAGNSVSFQSFKGGTFQFDEHGYFVIMCSIRPRPMYFQGLDKFKIKLTADKYLIPDFAQLGDDAIQPSEVYCDYQPSGLPANPFGYQQRYYEYMSHLNEVHGHMTSDLRFYHLGRYFDSFPPLNNEFVTVNIDQNDLNRIWSTFDETPFMMFIDFRHRMLRPLPDSTTYSL